MSYSGSEETKQPAILCDMCTGDDRRAALKTCMKCEIAMCVQHLQPHLTTPVLLLNHPLTEPMAPGAEGLGGTKCPQHGKLIEYYCLDDMTSVCVSCAIEDQHRLHNMKTLPKAHAELVERLADWKQAVDARRPASGKLGNWEKTQREELGRSSARLVEAVSKLREIALKRVGSSVSARTGAITTGGSSIQAAMGEKDTFRFLQLCSQVHRDVDRAKAVDLRTGLETGEERDKLTQELQDVGKDMMAQATKFWGSVLMFVDPENHQELPGNAMATFDPLSLGTGTGMSLSQDRRKVYYSNWSGTIPSHTLMIQRAQSSGIQRWTIAVSENCDWTIALCDTAAAIEQRNGCVYALCFQDDKVSYLTTEHNTVIEHDFIPGDGAEKMARPKTVEVSWNPSTFSLSFFTRSLHYQRRLLVSIDVSRRSPPLNPFVRLQSTALHRQQTQNIPNIYSNQQVRSRGMYNQGNAFGRNAFGNTLSQLVGQGPHITDVLCELL